MPPLPTILLILAAFSIGATVIAILVAFRSSREAQSAIFPILKEEEANRARRARISIFAWLAVTALLLGGWLASLRFTAAPNSTPQLPGVTEPSISLSTEEPPLTPGLETTAPSPTATALVIPDTSPATGAAESGNNSVAATSSPTPNPPTATSEPPTTTPTPVPPTATATSTQTATPSPPPTDTPTATSTPEPPTATPTSMADAASRPAGAARTPAPAEVRFGPIQFGTGVTDEVEIINPGTVFRPESGAIYAVYPFRGMEEGLDFSTVWYQNGVELGREETVWEFGESGTSFSFMMSRGPGLYKLELYVNDSVVATKLFEVR